MQLSSDNRCANSGQRERPVVCASLRAEPVMCGADREHALAWRARLAMATPS